MTASQVYNILHRLMAQAGLLGSKVGRRYTMRPHSIRKFFRTHKGRARWTDVDGSARVVTIRNPAKGGMPRQVHVSEKCIEMLSRQPEKGEYVFGADPDKIRRQMRKNFHWARGYIAAKTADEEFLKIYCTRSDISSRQNSTSRPGISATCRRRWATEA